MRQHRHPEGFLYIALNACTSRELDKNKIIQLPEKAFSGLTHLEDL